MSVQMTDIEPLREMHRILGGRLDEKGRMTKTGTKLAFLWSITNWSEVIKACEAIYGRLSPRRQAQIDVALSRRPKYPRGELCCPPEPIPSNRGYDRHRRLGIEPCEICLRSTYLYQRAQRLKRNPDAPERIIRTLGMDLICPSEPICSSAPYFRHRRLGIEPCTVCLASHSWYVTRGREKRAEAAAKLQEKRHAVSPGESDSI